MGDISDRHRSAGCISGYSGKKFQVVDAHGEKFTAKAMLDLLPVIRLILSVSRVVEEGFVVVMGNERGHKTSKNGREILRHKYNGVHRARATASSKLCPRRIQGMTMHQLQRLWERPTRGGHEGFRRNPH